MLFSGKGAGSLPSASAVLSDIVDIACHQGGFNATPGNRLNASARDCNGQHYLRFPVKDPSAIGAITTSLERDGIGVARAAAVWGKNGSSQHHVRVMTQACSRLKVDQTLKNIGAHTQGQSDALVLSVAE